MTYLIPFLAITSFSHAQFRPNPFSSSAANISTYDVDVGRAGLTFDPATIHASPGDIVNFHFWNGNHSVAQATFENPCQPKGDGAIYSGFVPSKVGGSANEMFSMRVNGTDPIWLYCSQTVDVDHCRGGQVMVINPPSDNSKTLKDYIKAAGSSSGTASPRNFFGGRTIVNNQVAPNVTATGVPAATQTKKSGGNTSFEPNMWVSLGIGALLMAAAL